MDAPVCITCGRPLGDLEAAGKVGRKHPETSQKAATVPLFGTQRHRVLEVLRQRVTATAAEVAAELDLSRNQTATRLLELHEGGYACYVLDEDGEPERRATGPSTEGRVHCLTPAGVAVLGIVEGSLSPTHP